MPQGQLHQLAASSSKIHKGETLSMLSSLKATQYNDIIIFAFTWYELLITPVFSLNRQKQAWILFIERIMKPKKTLSYLIEIMELNPS